MDYCSSIWGYNDNDKLDKIHMKAIRCYLGVNRYAPKAGIKGEIGWTPPQIRRHLNILRLWNKNSINGKHKITPSDLQFFTYFQHRQNMGH